MAPPSRRPSSPRPRASAPRASRPARRSRERSSRASRSAATAMMVGDHDHPRAARRRPPGRAPRAGRAARHPRGLRGGRRGRRRRGGRPRDPADQARRRPHGRADARHRRRRGDPPDPQGGPGDGRARADDVRRRRHRLHGDAGRGPRLPAQGRRAGRDRRRASGPWSRGQAIFGAGIASADARALREPARSRGAPTTRSPSSPPGRGRSSSCSPTGGVPRRSPRPCTSRRRRSATT